MAEPEEEIEPGAEAEEAAAEGEAALDGAEGGDEGIGEEELEQLEQQLGADDDVAEDGASGGTPTAAAEEAVTAASPAPDEDEDDEDLEGVDVQDHLKDAVEGSLRLKRLLSRDEDISPGKRRRVDPEGPAKQAKVRLLQTKWGLVHDAVIGHVLETCTLEELDELHKSGYAPDKFNMWKSTAEILARHCSEVKERKMVGGSTCDAISAFKFRWKLDLSADRQLRGLKHKELRYVLQNYDGSQNLEELIQEASNAEPDDENSTANALPHNPGVSTIGRFTRLELIDPLADCAVFGDANLTFALKLAKHRKALGHVGRVIATTFEELDTLRERYKEIDESIKTLEDHYAEVYHGVDCTRIAIDPRFQGMEGSLGAVYYNFPHSGAIQGFFDGHPIVNWRHENLMRLFFRALRSFVKPGGFVKVSSNMGAVGVRYSYIIGSALENEFLHIETVPFLEWHLHRYGRSYGDKRDVYKRPDAVNNQSYNAQAADRDMVYCFCYAPTGETLGKQRIRLPPTLKTLKACTDGPFKHLQGVAKDSLAKQLHKRFITEVSGTHVG